MAHPPNALQEVDLSTRHQEVRPWRLIVALFVAGGVIGGTIAVLGANGTLHGTIPGSPSGSGGTGGGGVTAPPPRGSSQCQGSAAAKAYHFVLIAGIANTFTFNDTVPGPCFVVGAGSNVSVTFEVSSQSGANHSWVLLPANGSTHGPPVFPGAGIANATRFSGLPPGSVTVFQFRAATAGSYKYVCEVDGHADLGMYGWFNVSGPAAGPAGSLGPTASLGGPATAGARPVRAEFR